MRTFFVGLLICGLGGTVGAAVGATPRLRAADPVAAAPAGGSEQEPSGRPARRQRAGRGSAAALRPAPPAPAPVAAAKPAAPNKSGIVFLGDNTWQVPESIVDRYVSDPSALSNQAGADQVANGWKLTSVKSGSRVAQLGFETGDVITSVNGYGLGSLTSTWYASTKLKNKDSYRVAIKRDGATKTLRYEVID